MHYGPVKQLHWAPNLPILLSVNCNELAWWNIGFLENDRNKFRRSRLGSNRFSKNLDFSENAGSSLETASSSNFLSESFQEKNEKLNYNVAEYWKKKRTKYGSERPALLNVISLPSYSTDIVKICVSKDFSKFLTVDINQMVNDYTLLEYA